MASIRAVSDGSESNRLGIVVFDLLSFQPALAAALLRGKSQFCDRPTHIVHWPLGKQHA